MTHSKLESPVNSTLYENTDLMYMIISTTMHMPAVVEPNKARYEEFGVRDVTIQPCFSYAHNIMFHIFYLYMVKSRKQTPGIIVD